MFQQSQWSAAGFQWRRDGRGKMQLLCTLIAQPPRGETFPYYQECRAAPRSGTETQSAPESRHDEPNDEGQFRPAHPEHPNLIQKQIAAIHLQQMDYPLLNTIVADWAALQSQETPSRGIFGQ